MAPFVSSSSLERYRRVAFDREFLDLLEAIPDPALVYLPGGEIAAVNRAAARLSGRLKRSDRPIVGMTVGDLIDRYRVRRADGGPLIRGDLPHVRALRGEVVAQGERIDVTFADGSVMRMVVTSRPVVVDGTVVAALSIWRDFDAFLRRLVRGPANLDIRDGEW